MFDDGEISLIEKDISAFSMSKDGRHIIFSKELQNNVGSLYIYNNVNKNIKQIVPDAVIINDGSLMITSTISQNGKCIGFATGNINIIPLDIDTYTFSSSKGLMDIGRNLLPISISDDGEKLIYSTIHSQTSYASCHIRYSGNDTKLFTQPSFESIPKHIFINPDMSTVLYFDGDGYFLWNNKDGIINITTYSKYLQDNIQIYDEFALYIQDNNTLIRINYNGIVEKIAYDVIHTSGYVDNVLYTTDEGLFLWNSQSTTHIVENVQYFDMSAANKTVLYIDTNKDLYQYTEDNSYNLIAHNVISASFQENTDRVYFIREDGSLYFVENKENPTLILEKPLLSIEKIY